MITHVLKNCSKTSLICWVKPSTTPNEAIKKNVFQISKNVLLWISLLKSVPSEVSPRDHDMMESARIENFEKEVVRTRPHKPRSNVFVASNPRVPSRIQYQAKDHQQFVRAISINKYLTTRTECFYMMFSEYFTHMSIFSHFSFLRIRIRKLCLHSFGCSNCFGRQISGILVGLEAHARWGETLHLKVKHDETWWNIDETM